MPVDHTPSVPAGLLYARPTLTALGTLADLTRGDGTNATPDALGSGTDFSSDGSDIL